MSGPSISSPPTCVTVTKLALLPLPFFFFSGLRPIPPPLDEVGTMDEEAGEERASLKFRWDWWRDRAGALDLLDGLSGCELERDRVDTPVVVVDEGDVADER